MRILTMLAVLALAAAAAYAQGGGTFHSLSCSSGLGTAWTSGQFGNTATSVDIYDGQTKILTVQTSWFANFQGTYNYSFSVPASLRDNQVHSVGARIVNTTSSWRIARCSSSARHPDGAPDYI